MSTTQASLIAVEHPIAGVQPVVIRWNRDGTYTPACPLCHYVGRDVRYRSNALSAVRHHITGKRHRALMRARD